MIGVPTKEGTLKSFLNVENKLKKKSPFYLEYVSPVHQVSGVPIKKKKRNDKFLK
jgi:hypothetical protein